MEQQLKSKQRVRDHGEVFTPKHIGLFDTVITAEEKSDKQ